MIKGKFLSSLFSSFLKPLKRKIKRTRLWLNVTKWIGENQRNVEHAQPSWNDWIHNQTSGVSFKISTVSIKLTTCLQDGRTASLIHLMSTNWNVFNTGLSTRRVFSETFIFYGVVPNLFYLNSGMNDFNWVFYTGIRYSVIFGPRMAGGKWAPHTFHAL